MATTQLHRTPTVPPRGSLPPARRDKANCLHIRLTGASGDLIDMTFRAVLAAQLPQLLPVAVRKRLRRRAVDVAAIAARTQGEGYLCGELFHFAEGSRVLRVWLE